MTAIAKAPALTLPSEITEPGWYWAEERIDGAAIEDSVYERCVVAMIENVAGAMLLEYDGATYDAAAADAWFRIIRRIEEPELRGGWA